MADTAEEGCFSFTWSHGETQESAVFQCHVFRCDIAEAVGRVSCKHLETLFQNVNVMHRFDFAACFAKAFQRVPKSMSSSVASVSDMMGSMTTTSAAEPRILMYVFEVSLEIKEDDGKGNVSITTQCLALKIRQLFHFL